MIIDINCDVGEGVGNENYLLPFISSCNIACGGHAGDANTINEVIELAKKYHVKVGAHPSFPDREIIANIVEKSSDIKQLVNKGCTLELCFTETKDYKHAVIKMSPEIRSLISRRKGQIYVVLNSCRAYDRFWVTQCYYSLEFGHISSKCSRN